MWRHRLKKHIVDKLEDIHPMRQVAYASVIQVCVLFGMLGCMAINEQIIKISKISKIFIINEFTFTKWKILDFKKI